MSIVKLIFGSCINKMNKENFINEQYRKSLICETLMITFQNLYFKYRNTDNGMLLKIQEEYEDIIFIKVQDIRNDIFCYFNDSLGENFITYYTFGFDNGDLADDLKKLEVINTEQYRKFKKIINIYSNAMCLNLNLAYQLD